MTAFWLIAFIALVAGEAATVGLVCIWFAAGALTALIAALLGVPQGRWEDFWSPCWAGSSGSS